jgi:hypothetical protein
LEFIRIFGKIKKNEVKNHIFAEMPQPIDPYPYRMLLYIATPLVTGDNPTNFFNLQVDKGFCFLLL